MLSRIILSVLFASVSFSQTFNFTGIIKEASSGSGLPYANISSINNDEGASADAGGKFSIKLKPGSYTFLVTYIGYKTEKINIDIYDSDICKAINLTSTDVLLQEVAVYASAGSNNNEASSNISMQSKDVEKTSSVLPDVFRSIQSLPGLSVNNELSAKFNVRGGNYDENLVLVNSTQVYEPFHLKEAENASVGIFNLDLMKKVNLITGGFSAEYGDRLSSVLNIEYRDGDKEKHKGTVSFSLLNIDGLAEGPITENLTYLVGFRQSYLKYVMNIMSFEEYIKPDFYDVQGVLTYSFSPVDKLQFKFIHAGDNFKYDPDWEYKNPVNFTRNWYNQTVDLTQKSWDYDHNESSYYSSLFDLKASVALSHNAFLNSTLSYYEQKDKEADTYLEWYRLSGTGSDQFFYNSDYSQYYENRLNIKTAEVKSVLDLKATPYYDIKTGFSFIHIDYLQDRIDKEFQIINENIQAFPSVRVDTINYGGPETESIRTGSYKLAGFAENIFQISDDFLVNAGIRTEYFEINRDLTCSPRLSASYKAGNSTTIRAAWGHYYQSPIYNQLAYAAASDTNTQSQMAVHYNLGIEHLIQDENNPLRNIKLKADFFYKKYSDLISSKRDAFGRLTYSRKNDSKAYAAGMDLYASLKYDWYSGWISYGLLFAKEDNLYDNIGYFPRYSDQRHTISFVNDFDIGKQWNLNLRFTYGSGFAFTPRESIYNSEENKYRWQDKETNSGRLPAYKRIDFKISKSFNMFGMLSSAYLDISNVANFKNVYGYEYEYDNYGLPEIEEVELWPIIPSIGFKINFE
ncbi:MAG: TonB-dependent receptor [Ignavibacteria bacterium]|nr:TonB-dependent receptor [Ignavibacteria bacterium]